MSWFNWFRRSDDDTFIEGYRLGLQHGMDDMEKAFLLDRFRSAEASYPDPDHINVYSMKEAARRFAQYKPREPAA